jgi:hypothetical protein
MITHENRFSRNRAAAMPSSLAADEHPEHPSLKPCLKTTSLIFSILASLGLNLNAATYSGLTGQTVQGYAQAVGPVSNLQNGSNFTPPTALVGNGLELWANFNDVFGQPWHLTVDFQDNYQVVFHTESPNPSANISGGTVGWNLSGFDFSIADFQAVSLPPYMNPVWSFDQNSIYVGFGSMGAWSPYDTYTFQIVPVPEPGSLTILGWGLLVMLSLRSRFRYGFTRAASKYKRNQLNYSA